MSAIRELPKAGRVWISRSSSILRAVQSAVSPAPRSQATMGIRLRIRTVAGARTIRLPHRAVFSLSQTAKAASSERSGWSRVWIFPAPNAAAARASCPGTNIRTSPPDSSTALLKRPGSSPKGHNTRISVMAAPPGAFPGQPRSPAPPGPPSALSAGPEIWIPWR